MKEEKEVDLLDIISYIAGYIQKKFLQILLVFIITTAIPVIYHLMQDKSFVSKMTIVTNGTVFTMVEELSEPLTRSIITNNDSAASILLNSNIDLIKSISNIQISEVEPHPAERKEGCTFNVELVTTDKGILKDLEQPILNYYNEDDFIKKITSVKLEQLKALNSEINLQIERLDSVQKMIPSAIENYKSEKAIWNDLNLGTIYEQMAMLKVQETDTKEKIDLIQEFKLLNGFKVVEAGKGFVFHAGIGIIAGLFINIIAFIVLSLNDMIKKKKAGAF